MSTLPETGQIIQNALNLIDSHHYADAKLAILPSKPTVISNIINLYGGESDFFIKHLNPYLKSTVRTTCNLNSCPKPFQAMFTLYRIGFCSVAKVAPAQCEQELMFCCCAEIVPKRSQCEQKPYPLCNFQRSLLICKDNLPKRGSVAISAPIKVFRLDSDRLKNLSDTERSTFNSGAEQYCSGAETASKPAFLV